MKKFLLATAITLFVSSQIYFSVAWAQENTESTKTQIISDEKAHEIVLNGTPNDVQKLLQSGYNVNKVYLCNTLLNTAIKSASKGSMMMDYPEYALEKVKILVEAGADVNSNACPGKVMLPLSWSLISPLQLQETEQEINKAINEKIKTGIEYCNWEGLVSKPCKDITPEEHKEIKEYFHKTFSVANKFLMPHFMNMTKYLIEKGANVNGTDIQGQTPLHHAVTISQEITTEPAKYLIEKGANVNARDAMGQTPLFFAYGAGNDEVVNMLINAGADINIRNNDNVKYNQVKAIINISDNSDVKYFKVKVIHRKDTLK